MEMNLIWGVFESKYTSTIVNDNNTCNLSLSNSPNPFNSTTIIHFSISKPSHVHLADIYHNRSKGYRFDDKTLPVGSYQTQWNGMDKSGNKISSGAHIILLNTEKRSLSRRVVFMK